MTAQFARAPHVGRSATMIHEPHAALLIDFDNVTMGIRSDLSKELKNLLNSDIIKGKVALQRAYADWRRYPQYIVPLAESSVDLIYAPAYGSQKKNATDIRLAIDALELVFTRPEIGTFILLSGDSDFSSLVLKLKEYGKYVVGVGIRESASDLLVQNCDEYYSYTALSGLKRTSEDSRPASYDVWELVEMAVQRMVSDGDVMRSDRMKQVLVKLDPNFDEKSIGFTKFNRFLQEAAKRGAVRLQKLENGQYEVGPPAAEAAPVVEAAPAPEPRESRDESRRRGRRGRGRRDVEPSTAAGDGAAADIGETPRAAPEPEIAETTTARTGPRSEVGAEADGLDAAFGLLRRAIRDLAEEAGGAARDSDVKRRMLELQSDWDEADYGFSKFSRFLRHAHDAEVVSLERMDNGNYEVRLTSEGGAARDDTDLKQRQPREAGTAARAEAKTERAAERPRPERAAGPAQAAASPTRAEPPPEPLAAAADPAATRAREEKPQAARTPPGVPVFGPRRGSRGGRVAAEGPPPLLAGQTIGPARPTDPAPAVEAVAPATEPPRAAGARKTRAARKAAKPASTAATDAGSGKTATPATTAAKDAGPGKRAKAAPAVAKDAGPGKTAKASITASAATDASALGLPADASAVVNYLTNRYKGVGKKSAEQLVEAFGAANVFDVLATAPERTREVLGEARGTKLLDAWEADQAQRLAVVTSAAEPDQGTPSDADSRPRGGRRPRGKRGGRGRKKTTSPA